MTYNLSLILVLVISILIIALPTITLSKTILTFYFGREFYYKKRIKPSKNAYTNTQISYQDIIPFYNKLSANDKMRFQDRINRFLNSYEIHLMHGLVLEKTDLECLAAIYVKLTWGYQHFLVKSFRYILIYPDAFPFENDTTLHQGHFNSSQKVITLSWNNLVQDYQFKDGKNLAIHEFTHAITKAFFTKKKQNGTSGELFKFYSSKINHLMAKKRYAKQVRDSNILRDYAFVNQIEFLAVLAETYFEKPKELKEQAPRLYCLVEKMLGYQGLLK